MADYALGGLAFSAGLIAFLNPCGIAMLPAYVSYYIEKKERENESKAIRVLRGLLLGTVVSAGFLFVFGLTGLAVAFLGSGFVSFAPLLTLIMGFVLAGLGAYLLAGKEISILPGLNRLGGRLQSTKNSNEYLAFFLYGIGYAIASISCTIPIFLYIVTAALTLNGIVQGLGVFLLYGAGMGIFMLAVSVATAISKELMIGYLKKHMPLIRKLSAIVVLLAGMYIIYYEVWIARVLELYFAWK